MSSLRPRQDRRAALLAAARPILSEKGLEATTVAEIVAQAGVAQGTFYLYFPSKLALVNALNEELNERMLVAVGEATSGATTAGEMVRAGVHAAFAVLDDYRDVLNVLRSRALYSPTKAEWESNFGPYHRLIAEIIRHRQASGEVDASIPSELTARLIVGLINHAADEYYIYAPEIPREHYIAEVVRFVQRALGL